MRRLAVAMILSGWALPLRAQAPELSVQRLFGTREWASELVTLQWHGIIPHSAKVRGWSITPSHFLNNQLDTVWLAE